MHYTEDTKKTLAAVSHINYESMMLLLTMLGAGGVPPPFPPRIRTCLSDKVTCKYHIQSLLNNVIHLSKSFFFFMSKRKKLLSFLLIASAILISSWILLWRRLRPNSVSTCVWIILPDRQMSKNHKNKRNFVIIWQKVNILGASELLVLNLS